MGVCVWGGGGVMTGSVYRVFILLRATLLGFPGAVPSFTGFFKGSRVHCT